LAHLALLLYETNCPIGPSCDAQDFLAHCNVSRDTLTAMCVAVVACIASSNPPPLVEIRATLTGCALFLALRQHLNPLTKPATAPHDIRILPVLKRISRANTIIG
jgi:hypothetical protein